MGKLSRRNVLSGAGSLAAIQPAVTTFTFAQASPRVVIVGGGAGGATVANHLKRAAPSIEVTLIDRSAQYTTCFFSNLAIGGFRTLESITHSYDTLAQQGVTVVTDTAVDVDTTRKVVTLMSGARVNYDKLVLSPGIDIRFDTIERFTPEVATEMPHAWRGGEQTAILIRQLEAMPDGGVVVMSAPPNPYRCPPGPYERTCMIANFLKTRKPRSKLIVLDPKRAISKQAVFQEAFKKYYDGIVEHYLTTDLDDYQVVSVDPATRTVTTKGGMKVKAAVANIVPAQRAGGIAVRAGCTEGDWCPVAPDTFQSTKVADVYVIGDSAVATDMPKSAFSANSQGKLVANLLVQALTGKDVFPSRLRNTCWSLLAANDSVKIGANYAPGEANGRKSLIASEAFVSEVGRDATERRQNYDESVGWYAAITADMFGRLA